MAAVLRTASAQRVAPLVLRALDAARVDTGTVAEPARREVAFRRAQELVALPAVVERALAPLHEAGLTPLVHKGAALVARYPGPGLRPMDDVDLIVPPGRLEEAISLLEGVGWKRGVHSLFGSQPDYDVGLVHPDTGGLPIELHFELQRDSQRTNELDAATLWSERIWSSVGGKPVWRTPPELELLALSTHAAKPFHVFNRLIWAVDLVVVSNASDIDWDVVNRRATELRCRLATAVGLRLARRLGASVPDELVALPPGVRRLGVLEPLLDPTWPFLVENRNRQGFALALVDDNRARVALIRDQIRYPPHGRSRAEAVVDQAKSAARMVLRTASRRW